MALRIILPSAIDAGTLVFEQINPSLVWSVPHNLGYEPGGIEVEDNQGNKRNPAIRHVNANLLALFFINPTAGKVRLS